MMDDHVIVKQRRHKPTDLPIPGLTDSATLRPFGQLVRFRQRQPVPDSVVVDIPYSHEPGERATGAEHASSQRRRK
jgi:hypothetical protein